MAIDPQAVNDAAKAVIPAAKKLLDLSGGMINPVGGGTTLPHADTVAALKTEAVAARAEWQTARDALDASLVP